MPKLAWSLLPAVLLACTPDSPVCDGQAAVGWTEASHGGDAEADYATVFPEDQLHRLDIAVCLDDLEAAGDELAALVKEYMDSSMPAPEAATACAGLAEGDACSYTSGGTSYGGICALDPEGHLGCAPTEGPTSSLSTEPMWFPVTVSLWGRSWPWVGMRYKGDSSLIHSFTSGSRKLPFRLDFDEYEGTHPETAEQRFFGFKKLTATPGFRDETYLREVLADEVFDAMGVPAPARVLAEVWVDIGRGPEYWGLYTLVEDPSDAMPDHLFGDGGSVYKPDGPCSDWTCFDPAGFEKKAGDEDDFSDVEAAVAALLADRSDPEAWRAGLEATFDVDGFLRWLAANTAMVNWDTYGVRGHNYYLLSDGLRLAWVPWDSSEAFRDDTFPAWSLSLDEVDDAWPLIRYLLDDPVYAAAWRDHVAALLDTPFEADAFATRTAALADLIRPSVEAEEAPFTQLESVGAWEGGLEEMVAFVRDRDTAVESWLAGR